MEQDNEKRKNSQSYQNITQLKPQILIILKLLGQDNVCMKAGHKK